MSLVQNFANAVRIRTGQKPLVVTTSTGMDEFEIWSPLIEMFTKRDSTTTQRLPCRFVAKASEGMCDPDKQLWNINVDIDNGRFNEPVKVGISYDSMLDFMKAREFRMAQEAGFSDGDNEIVTKRKPVVKRNNVLNFVK